MKRTALGRFKHEGISLTVGKNGRVVGYMGDDQRFDYLYKFISADNWEDMVARGESPLDRGVLYVAKFNDDGTGEWLKLNMKVPALKAAFGTKARMLVNTRHGRRHRGRHADGSPRVDHRPPRRRGVRHVDQQQSA